MFITYILIGFTALLSYMAFNNRALFDQLKHYPYEEKREKSYYRMLTSGFIHADMMHLIVNMYVLYGFGQQVEEYFYGLFGIYAGRLIFFAIYVLSIIIADLPSFIKHQDNPSYAAIGASGATSAIVLIYCMISPWSWLLLFFAIPIPAIVLAVLYLIYSSWAAKNSRDNIGHDAHFWGAIAGVSLFIMAKPSVAIDFFNRLMVGPNWPF